MARKCEITNRKYMVGNKVSHSKVKTKRRFQLNLKRRRLWVPSEGRYVTLTLSTRALRTIDKLGIEAVLLKLSQKEIE